MSRIRTIKPEFWTSEQIVECSIPARLLFIGMWNFADDQGVIPASAKQLKMQILPGDDLSVAQVLAMVKELIAQELVTEFKSENKQYWWITGWRRHQKIDRPSPKYPSPPLDEDSTNIRRGFDEDSTNIRRGFDEDSTQEGRGREGIGKDRKGMDGRGGEKERARAKSTSTDTPSAPTLKGSRLSLEVLPQDWQAWAERERPDLDPQRTFNTFHDYWISKPGADGMKLDWLATWRNWVRREHVQTRNATPRNGTPQKLLTPEQDEWHQIIHGTTNATCKIIEGEVVHEAH